MGETHEGVNCELGIDNFNFVVLNCGLCMIAYFQDENGDWWQGDIYPTLGHLLIVAVVMFVLFVLIGISVEVSRGARAQREREASKRLPDGLDPEEYYGGVYHWTCPKCGRVAESPGTGYLFCLTDGAYMELDYMLEEPDPRYYPISD
jgi:hypothetical protein